MWRNSLLNAVRLPCCATLVRLEIGEFFSVLYLEGPRVAVTRS